MGDLGLWCVFLCSPLLLILYRACDNLVIHFILFCFFIVKTCPHLKSCYKDRLKRVLEYVDKVKDFDDLISPNNLSLHFLGPEPSGGVLQRLETNKRSSFFFFF